ncbi:putative odorant-binding protein A5 [Planococcus citri]|uniref:putative odorant-binding protein A5 n=1 Tax=Planococcus citri TaxID=170843 RepID=UPI0031F8FF81
MLSYMNRTKSTPKSREKMLFNVKSRTKVTIFELYVRCSILSIMILLLWIAFCWNQSVAQERVGLPEDYESPEVKLRNASLKSFEQLADGYVRAKGCINPEWKTICKVEYPGGHKITEERRLELRHIQSAPKVTWPHKTTTLYVLAFLHIYNAYDVEKCFDQRILWLVGNIPGNDIGSGDVLVNYTAPNEPEDMDGPDSFMFVVYKQNSYKYFKQTFKREKDPRKLFLIETFAEHYDLGFPIHGNCFRLKWDENSPPKTHLYEEYSESMSKLP